MKLYTKGTTLGKHGIFAFNLDSLRLKTGKQAQDATALSTLPCLLNDQFEVFSLRKKQNRY